MAAKLSTGLRNYLAVTGSLKAALETCVLKIFSGTEPATADTALSGNTLLCEVSTSGTVDDPLNFEASASAGVLLKLAAETWQGVNAATGTAAFFRFETPADAGGASTTLVRLQGTVALAGGDLNLSSLSLTSAATQTVDNFAITVPAV